MSLHLRLDLVQSINIVENTPIVPNNVDHFFRLLDSSLSLKDLVAFKEASIFEPADNIIIVSNNHGNTIIDALR